MHRIAPRVVDRVRYRRTPGAGARGPRRAGCRQVARDRAARATQGVPQLEPLQVGEVETDAGLERVVEAYRTSLIPERLAAAAHVAPEHAFAVTLDGAVLIGAMDVLARLEGEALIVDFKTGRGGKDAARDARHENQARCYALAALREGAARVEALFVELERGGDVERFTFDAADERAIEDELNERVRRIRNEPPKPLGRYAPDVCGDCPALGGLCPVEPPRRRSR